MTEPTSPARDSSRRNRKAPGNVSLSNLTAPRLECSASGLEAPAIVLAAKSLTKAAFGANRPARILNDDAHLAAMFTELQGVRNGHLKRQVARQIGPQFPAFDLGRPTAGKRRLYATR